jgi:hypothetical protein
MDMQPVRAAMVIAMPTMRTTTKDKCSNNINNSPFTTTTKISTTIAHCHDSWWDNHPLQSYHPLLVPVI